MTFVIHRKYIKKEQWDLCNKGTQAAANMEAYIARIIGKDNFVPGHKPLLQDHKSKKT